MSERGHLFDNLLLFGRILHHAGLDVNPGRMVDLIQALELVSLRRRTDVYFTLRGLLVHRREEIPLFDEAFEQFWREHGPALEVDMSAIAGLPQPPKPETIVLPAGALEQSETDSAEQNDAQQTIIEVTRTPSRRELLSVKDFADMTPEELVAVRRMLSQFVWSLGERRTRRLSTGGGAMLDVRRSVRRNLRYGGELLELSQRARKIKPRPLVVIADISGSMERYTRLLLHFIYSLSRGLEQRVEAFVFGTRLTRITRPLHNRDIERALRNVSATVVDWSGGTRIGDSIKLFNHEWGRRVLRGGAVVLIISDGWDRGDPEVLGKQMERLNKTCHRLIWLNPLLGSARYEPLTRGIVAALPHVDDFLPVHNLASLEALGAHLALLDQRKRRRIQVGGAAFIGR